MTSRIAKTSRLFDVLDKWVSGKSMGQHKSEGGFSKESRYAESSVHVLRLFFTHEWKCLEQVSWPRNEANLLMKFHSCLISIVQYGIYFF